MKNILDRYAATLAPAEDDALAAVRAFAAWQIGRQEGEFTPTANDDVDLRNYFLHLRINRAKPKRLGQIARALRDFYDWAEKNGLIAENPFTEFDLSDPLLRREQLRRRRENLPADPTHREVARLRALNQLAQKLNGAVDMHTAIDAALETLVAVMGLQTAWAFVLPGLHRYMAHISAPPHDFAVVQAINLPPGLEMEERRYLCQPGDCHCQWLLRHGRLQRAVNVVECTRLQDAARARGENLELRFHASMPLRVGGEMMGIINVAAAEWQFLTAADLQFLSTVGAHVGATLERARLYDLSRAHRTRMAQELEMARELQAHLLPSALPEPHGWRLAAHWQAAREMAGDFYDAFQVEDGRIALLIADVSDKGAHAALYMAMVSSLIRIHARLESDPAALLTAVNDHLVAHDSSSMFVTVFYGLLDPRSGRFTYAGAGHDPPLLRRRQGTAERLMPTGPLLGILDGIQLAKRTIQLQAGDTLLLYTDGVTDLLNENRVEYGRDRLQARLVAAPAAADGCLAYICADLTRFRGAATPPDDITLLVLAAGAGDESQIV